MALHNHLNYTITMVLESYQALIKMYPINPQLSSRVLKALDNATLGYYTPGPEEEPFLQLLDLVRRLISIIYLANNITLYDKEVSGLWHTMHKCPLLTKVYD